MGFESSEHGTRGILFTLYHTIAQNSHNKMISFDIQANPTKFLTKDEQRIFKGERKSTSNAYSLFVKDTYPKLKGEYDSKVIFRELANRWKAIDPKKKKKYHDKAEAVS